MVTFPLLNLELNLSPIAFSIFGLSVSWYAIITVIAIIIGMVLCKKNDGKYGITYETITDLLIYLIPIGFISARLYYVAFNFESFRYNLSQILNFKTGGQAIYGTIIRRSYNDNFILQKKKSKCIRYVGLFSSVFGVRPVHR